MSTVAGKTTMPPHQRFLFNLIPWTVLVASSYEWTPRAKQGTVIHWRCATVSCSYSLGWAGHYPLALRYSQSLLQVRIRRSVLLRLPSDHVYIAWASTFITHKHSPKEEKPHLKRFQDQKETYAQRLTPFRTTYFRLNLCLLQLLSLLLLSLYMLLYLYTSKSYCGCHPTTYL